MMTQYLILILFRDSKLSSLITNYVHVAGCPQAVRKQEREPQSCDANASPTEPKQLHVIETQRISRQEPSSRQIDHAHLTIHPKLHGPESVFFGVHSNFSMILKVTKT
jgi:hypothetical protein